MGKKRKHLSHAEIWDDSALVDSWNDALEEYKLYHSIHAKGERVEDVIKDFEESNGATHSTKDQFGLDGQAQDVEQELEDGEWEDGPDASGAADPALATEGFVASAGAQAIPEANAETPNTSMPIPAPFPPQFQDEALKSLMMSWYWSGYYTGFYQGQQQAQAKPDTNG